MLFGRGAVAMKEITFSWVELHGAIHYAHTWSMTNIISIAMSNAARHAAATPVFRAIHT
jgi:hypothetical protein